MPMVNISAADRHVLHSALKLWIKNGRAAQGTIKGLGKDDMMRTLESDIDDIESRLLPRFDEQVSLELSKGADSAQTSIS